MELFANSGLTEFEQHMTFDNYEVSGGNSKARLQAYRAASERSCLILAGSFGVGKTHLAVAIAQYAMEDGRQAFFRDVGSLLDELRQANFADTDSYRELMRAYKSVPCLVLDDMGKERVTDAGQDYLYQIVYDRDRHGLQTILTTNARSYDELCSWSGKDGGSNYVLPIVSRIRGRGAWVTIGNTGDYRQKGARHAV